MKRAFALACALMALCALPALASPGGTDGNGGHIDSATGEYHFHHGYPAHQHINGVCPYDPNFTSNVITGPTEAKKDSGSEDKDDVVVPSASKSRDGTFSGMEKRGRAGLIASDIALALVVIGGFLCTIKRKKSPNPRRNSENSPESKFGRAG